METIKVNMNPNPLDVQTIHASQNDGEARQWEFELHNNGELIDTSEVTEQMFFKAYKGGTEQILPENTSTPTTSPFIGDIRYPQGLLTDQEFTYRQSPTEEDGLAKITDIKGNTLVWNQLVQNGNFTSKSGWYSVRGSIAVSNNILSYTSSQIGGGSAQNRITRNVSFVGGHKYLLSVECKPAHATTLTVQFIQGTFIAQLTDVSAVWSRQTFILEPTNAVTEMYIGLAETSTNGYAVGDIDQYRNIQIFDLTLMGLDSITVDEFTSLFPLPFYDYNQGTLLSFNGNGIKTTGKNLVFKTISNSSINGSGEIISTSNFQMSVASVLKGKEYVITTNDNSKKVLGFFYDEPVVGSVSYNRERVDDSSSYTFTSPITGYVAFRSLGGYSTPMLEFGSVASDYEPYTESTLSLPISTYFPNGMKSAGNVYDELTESKAITRVGSVDLGSLTWVYYSAQNRFAVVLNNGKPSGTGLGLDGVCDKYAVSKVRYAELPDQSLSVGTNFFSSATCAIVVHDENYMDATTFKQAMADQNAKLYYELATPTETSFTTASLVTENAEIPLSNEDGVLLGKCTEQLSENPGFIDAKIKLSDSDGTCYSNKLQLHVERSPQ